MPGRATGHVTGLAVEMRDGRARGGAGQGRVLPFTTRKTLVIMPKRFKTGRLASWMRTRGSATAARVASSTKFCPPAARGDLLAELARQAGADDGLVVVVARLDVDHVHRAEVVRVPPLQLCRARASALCGGGWRGRVCCVAVVCVLVKNEGKARVARA